MKFKIIPVLILVVLITFSATAQDSQSTSSVNPGLVPGDFFYPVESFVESLEVSIAGIVGGEDFKAKAMANNAEERLAEAEELAERNRTDKAVEMTERYAQEINRSREMAAKNGNIKLSNKIDGISRSNIEKLEKVRDKVPEKAKERIDKAIERSKKKTKPGSASGKAEIGPKNSKNLENNTPKPKKPSENKSIRHKAPERDKGKNLSAKESSLGDNKKDLNRTREKTIPENSSGSSKETDDLQNDDNAERPSTSPESDKEEGSEKPLEKDREGLL